MSALPTVERLKLQAIRASDISRQMAEAKSLRQESNPEGRTDLYMWPTPEQTTEGKAAELIAELYEALEDIDRRILCPVGPSPSLETIQQIASAAIAKARGEQ